MITSFNQTRKKKFVPSPKLIKKIIRAVFKNEGKRLSGDISIIFVDNRTIKKINKKYLNHNYSTDVIAFPYGNSPNFLSKDENMVGDIFISVPMAQWNARRWKEPPQKEIVRLIIHGVLHLLGYEDHPSPKKKIMWKKQEKIVGLIFKPSL